MKLIITEHTSKHLTRSLLKSMKSPEVVKVNSATYIENLHKFKKYPTISVAEGSGLYACKKPLDIIDGFKISSEIKKNKKARFLINPFNIENIPDLISQWIQIQNIIPHVKVPNFSYSEKINNEGIVSKPYLFHKWSKHQALDKEISKSHFKFSYDKPPPDYLPLVISFFGKNFSIAEDENKYDKKVLDTINTLNYIRISWDLDIGEGIIFTNNKEVLFGSISPYPVISGMSVNFQKLVQKFEEECLC